MKVPDKIIQALEKRNLITVDRAQPATDIISQQIEQIDKEVKEKQELSLSLREKLLTVREKEFELKVAKNKLLENPIFKHIQSVEHLRIFMQWHVFAVWDFMSLIKRLQNDLTCTSLPWMPNRFPDAARLVNEIVLGEETDETPLKDAHISHFDLYIKAMEEIQADTSQIKKFITLVQNGSNYQDALIMCQAPEPVRNFVVFTIETALHASTCEVLGSFFHGRENIIPDMFTNLLHQWNIDSQNSSMFVYYVKRHIEVDSGEHGPASEKIMSIVTQSDPQQIIELLDCAIKSVEMRNTLWSELNKSFKSFLVE